jgi:uncharacterized protein YhdP
VLSGSFLRHVELRGQWDPATGLWRAAGAVHGLTLEKQLLACLPAECRQYGELCDAFHLSISANFDATNHQPDGGWCRVSASGQLEGRIEDKRLPFPLTDVKGKFRSDGRTLQFDELTARAGMATLSGTCNIGGFYEDAPCSFSVSARQFHVDPQLVELLPEQWREIWGKVRPEGLIDAEAGVVFDGRTIRHQAEVVCHNVSFAYHKFPYRMSNGTGTIYWRNGVLQLKGFVALANGKPVTIDAEIENPGPQYSGYVKVLANEPVRIDERLILALPESARKIVNQLQPQGGFVTFDSRFDSARTTCPSPTSSVNRSGLRRRQSGIVCSRVARWTR